MDEKLYCAECNRMLDQGETHVDLEELEITLDMRDGEIEIDGNVYLLCDYCDERVAEGYFNDKDYVEIDISPEIESAELRGDIVQIDYLITDGFNLSITGTSEMTLEDCGMMPLHTSEEEKGIAKELELEAEIERKQRELEALMDRLKAQRESA